MNWFPENLKVPHGLESLRADTAERMLNAVRTNSVPRFLTRTLRLMPAAFIAFSALSILQAFLSPYFPILIKDILNAHAAGVTITAALALAVLLPVLVSACNFAANLIQQVFIESSRQILSSHLLFEPGKARSISAESVAFLKGFYEREAGELAGYPFFLVGAVTLAIQTVFSVYALWVCLGSASTIVIGGGVLLLMLSRWVGRVRTKQMLNLRQAHQERIGKLSFITEQLEKLQFFVDPGIIRAAADAERTRECRSLKGFYFSMALTFLCQKLPVLALPVLSMLVARHLLNREVSSAELLGGIIATQQFSGCIVGVIGVSVISSQFQAAWKRLRDFFRENPEDVPSEHEERSAGVVASVNVARLVHFKKGRGDSSRTLAGLAECVRRAGRRVAYVPMEVHLTRGSAWDNRNHSV